MDGRDAAQVAPATLARAALVTQDRDTRDAVLGWLCPGVAPLADLDGRRVAAVRGALPIAWAAEPSAVAAAHIAVERLIAASRHLPTAHATCLLTVLASLA